MKLFALEPDFFSGHLNGARIPIFLMMLQELKQGRDVHALCGRQRFAVTLEQWPASMDEAYIVLRRTPVDTPASYEEMVTQKGHAPHPGALEDLDIASRSLLLNDSQARQAVNQLYELLSGRFGFDRFRLAAPLRIVQGLRRDRAMLRRYDRVYVQTEPERRFLQQPFIGGDPGRIGIFNNMSVTLELFPRKKLREQGDKALRADCFLLAVPPGRQRLGEYRWFLRRLAREPELLNRTTVLGPPALRDLLPREVAFVSEVPEIDSFFSEFACVLVPTRHYTGMNNRVFQAALAGCDIICSREAVQGLNNAPSVRARCCNSFADYAHAMASYPAGGVYLTPADILGTER